MYVKDKSFYLIFSEDITSIVVRDRAWSNSRKNVTRYQWENSLIDSNIDRKHILQFSVLLWYHQLSNQSMYYSPYFYANKKKLYVDTIFFSVCFNIYCLCKRMFIEPHLFYSLKCRFCHFNAINLYVNSKTQLYLNLVWYINHYFINSLLCFLFTFLTKTTDINFQNAGLKLQQTTLITHCTCTLSIFHNRTAFLHSLIYRPEIQNANLTLEYLPKFYIR